MVVDRCAPSSTGRSGRPRLSGAASLLERRPTQRSATLAVLTYHRVAPVDHRPDLHPGLRSADPASVRCADGLAGRQHDTGTAGRCPRRRVDDRPLPDRAVLVTFDDAYADFATWAWPALRRHGVPATMFVPTAYPDTDRTFWWDRLHHAVTSTSRRGPSSWPAAAAAGHVRRPGRHVPAAPYPCARPSPRPGHGPGGLGARAHRRRRPRAGHAVVAAARRPRRRRRHPRAALADAPTTASPSHRGAGRRVERLRGDLRARRLRLCPGVRLPGRRP